MKEVACSTAWHDYVRPQRLHGRGRLLYIIISSINITTCIITIDNNHNNDNDNNNKSLCARNSAMLETNIHMLSTGNHTNNEKLR